MLRRFNKVHLSLSHDSLGPGFIRIVNADDYLEYCSQITKNHEEHSSRVIVIYIENRL